MGKRLSHAEIRDRRNRCIQAEILRQIAEAGGDPYKIPMGQFLENSQIGPISVKEALHAIRTFPKPEDLDGQQ